MTLLFAHLRRLRLASAVATAMALRGACTGTPGTPWKSLPPLPTGIAGFAYGMLSGRLIVAGGTAWAKGVKRTSTAVHQFDPLSASWLSVQRLPRPFAYGVFATWHHTLYLAGGTDGAATDCDCVELDSSAAPPNWRLPTSLAYAGHARVADRLFVLGGTPDIHRLSALTADFWSINLQDGSHERLPPYPAGPVLHAALVPVGDAIFVFPGGTVQPGTDRLRNTRSVYRYDISARTWTPLAPYPYPVRGLGACALDSHHLLTTGGERTEPAGPTDQCFVYEVERDRYVSLPPVPYAAMLEGLQTSASWVYLFGGEDGPDHRANALCRARIAVLLQAARNVDRLIH